MITSTGPGVVDQGPHHRVQNAPYGQENGHKVQGHGKGHVAPDGPHHPLGQPEQVGQLLNVVAYQGDVRRVHGDVAAHPAHGDAHMGLLQGRGVVDPVPDHADRLPRLLAVVDVAELILRQAAGADGLDAQLPGDVPRRVLVVPGEQHRFRAGRPESAVTWAAWGRRVSDRARKPARVPSTPQ